MTIGILSVLATSANAFTWSSPYWEYEKYDEHKYLDQDVGTADEWHKSYEQFAIEHEQRKNWRKKYEKYIK